jgi:hypothetical protein
LIFPDLARATRQRVLARPSPPVRPDDGSAADHERARVGPTTPTRAGRLADASVDPNEARNKFIDPAVTVATVAGHSSRLSSDIPEVFRQLVMSAVLGPVLG